jgi:predicted RNase H-like HicB family nuclease
MKSLQNYISIIRPDDNGTFVAYVPAIPSCHALGRTQEEAIQNLKDVFRMIQTEYQEEGRSMPEEVQLFVIPKSFEAPISSM